MLALCSYSQLSRSFVVTFLFGVSCPLDSGLILTSRACLAKRTPHDGDARRVLAARARREGRGRDARGRQPAHAPATERQEPTHAPTASESLGGRGLDDPGASRKAALEPRVGGRGGALHADGLEHARVTRGHRHAARRAR